MASWATKRKFLYGGSFLLIFFLITAGIFWKVVYRTPTCDDGRKNGDEKGIDCGGNCKNICTADTLSPIVIWSKIFNISGDVYTAVSFVENPNINSKNPKANYQFDIYDSDNKLILSKQGETSIPKGKKFAVFETGIVLKGVKPKSTDFKFLSLSNWQKDTELEPEVVLKYGTLISTSTTPKIIGTITSNSLKTIPEIELDVFVLDSKENVVAASRSFVDNLLPKQTQDFVFTWQKSFDLGVEACRDSLDLVLALDRSGSMRSESSNPPEPFETVKKTAVDFVRNLSSSDKVSVISFGDDARIEKSLSSNKNDIVSSIQNLSLSTTTDENTNIFSALEKAKEELGSLSPRDENKRAIILLTDGVPNLPKDPNFSSYPISSAQNISKEINSQNITIYTIGLGKNINEGFLLSISSNDQSYFTSPTKYTLSSIYEKISSNLCVKKPNVITVIYRTL